MRNVNYELSIGISSSRKLKSIVILVMVTVKLNFQIANPC